ncbi:MAG: ABC transporter ATP-binding protein [Caldilineaceae bacterium]|nr:ABC transporter ATP-binding protein [Caldilineaceae bacterium]
MTSNGKAKIVAENLTKVYETAQSTSLLVLSDMNAEIYDNEFVSIIGPSGCGKTTFLNIVAGLILPTRGRVLVDGKEVSGPGRERGVVFQQDAILLWRKVLDNVAYGLEIRGVGRKERAAVALDYLKLVGLEKFADFFPKELSGGMKKKVQIAAVLANTPEVMLMDEPFGSLDYLTKVELQGELLRIWTQDPKTVLFITHDVEEAIFLSDRVLMMSKGKLERGFKVPFERPRNNEIRARPEFHELKAELWRYLA